MCRKRKRFLYAMNVAFALPMLLLAGCGTKEPDTTEKAYYVISEELDVKKTADKAQEILENADLEKINP